MRTAAAVVALAAAAEAFAPAPASVARIGGRQALSMTLAPPETPSSAVPEIKLPRNLAQERALEANKKQWGITEPLDVASAPLRKDTDTLVRESAERAFAKPASPAQAPEAKLPLNKAKEGAMAANQKTWGIEGPLAPGAAASAASAPASSAAASPAAGVPGFRPVTNDEVRAIAAKFPGASREEAEAPLAALGYEGALLDAVWRGVEEVRAGKLAPAPGDAEAAEAAELAARSARSLEKATKLEADAAAADARAKDELAPKVEGFEKQLAEARETAEAWSWNPFSNAQNKAQELEQQLSVAKGALEALRTEAAEGVAGAAAMRAAAQTEAEAASAKRAEATKIRLAAATAAQAKAVAALEAELAKWESMREEEGAAASRTPAALQLLADAGVQPSARAGLRSLAGRVAKVRVGEEPTTLLCDTLQKKKSPASAGGEGGSEAVLGAVLAAAAAGVGYAVSQGYVQIGMAAGGAAAGGN